MRRRLTSHRASKASAVGVLREFGPSDEFGCLLRRPGLRRITLHDSRHTTLTLMEHAGVPISIISKWAGHYDSAFTQKTYVHASEGDLHRGQAALARIHKIA
jgi:Phage integrase family